MRGIALTSGIFCKQDGNDGEERQQKEIDCEEGQKTRGKEAGVSIGRQRAGKNGKVDKQPQVKQQAAPAHAMFLYGDDAWSLRYFDQNDLHFLEREVFG